MLPVAVYWGLKTDQSKKVKVRDVTIYVAWCTVSVVIANCVFALNEIRIAIFVVLAFGGMALARFVDEARR